MTPLSATVMPPISAMAAVSATRAPMPFADGTSPVNGIAALVQPSSQVSLSGLGRTFSALSDLRISAAGMQDVGVAALTHEKVTAFAVAMNRFMQSLAVTAGSADFEADGSQLPELSALSNVLLQRGQVTEPGAALESIGIRFGVDGNINIDTAQFSRALAQDPLRTIGLLADTTSQLDGLRTTIGVNASILDASALNVAATRLSAADQAAADFLSGSTANGAASGVLPFQTARALRSFLDIAAL